MNNSIKFLGMVFVYTIISYFSICITLNTAYKNDSKAMYFAIPIIICSVMRLFSIKIASNYTTAIPTAFSIIFVYFLALSINSGSSLFDSKGWENTGMAITSAIFIICWMLITFGNNIWKHSIKKWNIL